MLKGVGAGQELLSYNAYAVKHNLCFILSLFFVVQMSCTLVQNGV